MQCNAKQSKSDSQLFGRVMVQELILKVCLNTVYFTENEKLLMKVL